MNRTKFVLTAVVVASTEAGVLALKVTRMGQICDAPLKANGGCGNGLPTDPYLVFACCLSCFFILNGYRERTPFRRIVLMVIILWLVNAGFTIFASPAALRFQAFPMMLVTIFSIALLDWMIQQMKLVAGDKVDRKQHETKDTVKAENLLQA